MINLGLVPNQVMFFRLWFLIVISIIFALFDVFNKRNIPDTVAFASVIIGIAFALTSPLPTLVFSLLLALAIAALSYLLYKAGQLGAGDGFEFVAISLLIPLQPVPYILPVNQLALPFILSVFVATGLVTVVGVPIYYLGLARKHGSQYNVRMDRNAYLKAIAILAAYTLLLIFIINTFGYKPLTVVIVGLIAIPSAITALYEKKINFEMVKEIPPRQLEDGDLIAVNLMDKHELDYFHSKYEDFGRLVTIPLIRKMKTEKRKLPVYKNAVPLALLTLIGVVIALLYGNLLLTII